METIDDTRLQEMLTQAAKMGAQQAIDEVTLYTMGDAAKRLGISYVTLRKRVLEGKIRTMDGRISGVEIRRYLSEPGRNRRR